MTESVLPLLSDFVAGQMGLHFPPERWRDLERGIGSAAREFGFTDTDAFAQWLLSSPLTRDRVEVLASHLTVGETYFFRDKRIFELLEEQVLPELIRARRTAGQRLRIWSAGCATGEEPYSIAILLHKLIPDLERWNITLLATDINPRFLQKASAGEYGEWSFRDTPLWVRERYFRKSEGSRYRIAPFIQKLVLFSHLNLAEDAYPSLSNDTNAIDVIFCRNVLMYFAPERQKRVAENFHRTLVDGGWLIVSPSEASHVLFSKFTTANFPSAILYRKVSDRAASADALLSYMRDEPTSQLPFATLCTDEPEPGAVVPEFHDLPAPAADDIPEKPIPASPYHEALNLYQLGRYGEGAEKLALWLSENQNDGPAMNLMARLHANQGHLAQALEWCEKALAADKLNTGCHYLRAMILQEHAAAEEAVVSLRRALYVDPQFVMAHYSLGNFALRQGKTKEAEKHFDNALSLLRLYPPEGIVPESEGITAARLAEIIESTCCRGTLA